MKALRFIARPAAGMPRTVVTLSAGFFFVFMGASAFQQFLIPYLTDKGVTSAFQASTVLAVVYISFLVWRAVVAYTLYYLGEYWSTVLGAATYSLFAIGAFALNRFEFLLIAAGMWGWGAAAMWISSTTQLLDATADTHYGRASGLLYTATTGGQAIGVLFLGVLMSVTNVEFGPLVAAGITAIGVAVFLFLPYQHTKRVKPRLAPVFKVLTVPRTGLAALFLFLSSLAFGLILGSFSQIIGGEQGHGALALITAGYWITRIFGSYLGGVIADRLGREHVLILSFGMAGLGLLLPTFVSGAFTHEYCGAGDGLAQQHGAGCDQCHDWRSYNVQQSPPCHRIAIRVARPWRRHCDSGRSGHHFARRQRTIDLWDFWRGVLGCSRIRLLAQRATDS